MGALGARLAQFAGQIGATLLVGLPNALGAELVCSGCAIWPAQASMATGAPVVRAIIISAPFTLVAVGLWLVSALPLARDARRALASVTGAPPLRWAGRLLALPAPDARWWGRFMLVTGAALTLLQYMVSQASYTFPTYTNRYLIGLYIAAPLVAAPLYTALRSVWRAARARTAPGWRALVGSRAAGDNPGPGRGGRGPRGRGRERRHDLRRPNQHTRRAVGRVPRSASCDQFQHRLLDMWTANSRHARATQLRGCELRMTPSRRASTGIRPP